MAVLLVDTDTHMAALPVDMDMDMAVLPVDMDTDTATDTYMAGLVEEVASEVELVADLELAVMVAMEEEVAS